MPFFAIILTALRTRFQKPLFGWVLLALPPATSLAGGLQLTEIMYHPASTNRLEEWFEISNADANPIDLSGWKVTRGVTYGFPADLILEPGGYLVVAADTNTFRARHPAVTLVVGGWRGYLSHDGEEIRIEDAAGNVMAGVTYAPEGDWALRRIGAPDRWNRAGWEWYAGHAGLGKSLELVNQEMPADLGSNWGSSLVDGGTPGRPNSIRGSDAAPIITDVAHAPIVPRSSDPVTITARVLDEQTLGVEASLHWRVDGDEVFNTVAMFDDGSHGDGLAEDGVLGAILPPRPQGTVVEFHLTARDSTGNSRTFPNAEPSGGLRTANPAYQVDDSIYSGDQPLLRLIMTRAEHDYLSNQIWNGEPSSDASVNASFVSLDGVLNGGTSTQSRYDVSIRNRGHGTRTAVPHNLHVGFPKDRTWKGRAGINLNSHYTHSQHLGSAVFRRVGLPMAESRPVQVRLNGAQLAKPGQEQFGSYAANELVDDRLVQRQFPLDDGGNLYRGIRDMLPGISSDADLTWQGTSPAGYTNAYVKENHVAIDDWSDLIHLIDVLNHTPDAGYVEAVKQVVNVDAWMKYFAVNTLLDNQENSLGIGQGDDFGLYRGEHDPRFVPMAYDMDSLMGRGLRDTTYADGLWRMTRLPVIDRFMKHPAFVPLYFEHLQELAETAFSPSEIDALVDNSLGGYVDALTRRNLKAFNVSHVAHVLSQFPRSLTVTHGLPIAGGYPRTTQASITLSGRADAIETRRVLVNGSEASWTAWEGAWTNQAVRLHPGLNRILAQALDEGERVLEDTVLEVWYDDGSEQNIAGRLAADTVWTAAGGPYRVSGNFVIEAGATLTIEPGTSVFLSAGADLTVARGGRLIAEGTPTEPILFESPPGETSSWRGVVIDGQVGSPESRISYAHFAGNGMTCIDVAGGALLLDHATFGTTTHPYLSLDASSFVISHCHFPATTAAFEPVHGTGGIKSGGRGIIRDSYFGSSIGYNDIVDFTGGNRPGQPIIQFYGNVFAGSSDDILDLDGTDAWIEGNIFLHVHRDGSPDSASAVSGGNSGGSTSELTLVGNLFFDCDNAVTAKQGNFYILLNNTVVRVTQAGGEDFDSGVVNVRDTAPDLTSFGLGAHVEGNIIVDAARLVRNHDPLQTTVTFVNNFLPRPWEGPGDGNSLFDPLLRHIPTIGETSFANWEEAQVMWTWLGLLPGSPARGGGPGGRDHGGVVARGASISGEPEGTTRATDASLTVGFNRAGPGIPSAGFPQGSGFTSYRWRLDMGEWSAATPIASPILLADLSEGPHRVEVSGRNDAGLDQDDPSLGSEGVATISRTWTVNTHFVPPAARPTIRINEVLASNLGSVSESGRTPDLIELFNTGPDAVDLSGMGLTDDPLAPFKYSFPSETVIPGRGFLVVEADDPSGGPGIFTGFKLSQSGDIVLLSDAPGRGGEKLDSVTFGSQVTDLSIGRMSDGEWGLCHPSFGSTNQPIPTGNPRGLRINEWLADAQFVAPNDFVELHNPDPLPVALGGLHLSDAAGAPTRHAIAPLSFIPGRGYAQFVADGDPTQGSEHLDFKLSPDVGLILLSDADSSIIDAVTYGAQRTDVSQGRSPDGASTIAPFTYPTPGGGNPGAPAGDCALVTTTVNLLPLGATWKYQQTGNLDGTGWQRPEYDDSAWPSGPALLGVESSTLPDPGLQTPLSLGRATYYFRTRFLVGTNLDGFSLNLKTVLDDGALAHLNGAPLITNGLPSGAPAYSTFASRNVGDATTEFFTAPAGLLVLGTNVLAVEVHQVNASSSDIVWGLALDASRTETNCAPAGVLDLALTEVLAWNGSGAGFVEVLNVGTNALDLAGLSLSDDSAFPRKWVFPAPAPLEAGARRVIVCDGGQPPSPTNTGFGLERDGGAVFLFNGPDAGGDLIDAIQYGVQASGFSIARWPDGNGVWNLALPTPGAANEAAALGSVSALRINEWMADPADGAEDWLELHSSAGLPVPLGGLHLTDDLGNRTLSPIAPLSFIGTGAHAYVRFIADGDSRRGANHTDFALKKSGESIGLFSPAGLMLDGLSFGPQATGVSQGRFPDGAASIVAFATTASPAESNHLPLTDAVINEVLTHAEPPLEDAVELHNPTESVLAIGGWFLSNSRHDLKKYRIPVGSVLPPKGFAVFYEADFNSGSSPFTLDPTRGDQVVLSEADPLGNLTGYRDSVEFGAAETGVSFGRIPIRAGFDFGPLRSRTFGQDSPPDVETFRTGSGLPNAAPRVGPVVISEIMYLSADNGSGGVDDEFLELRNISAEPVPLDDQRSPAMGWVLRGGIDFPFPPGISVPPGGYVVVVGFPPSDPSLLGAFRSRFSVPLDVPVLGPWSGRLGDDGDLIELVKPRGAPLAQASEPGLAPLVLVDKVHYRPTVPWPPIAPGLAESLQRVPVQGYGNDPGTWRAATPSAGRINLVTPQDTDRDGLDDAWELSYFGTLARDGSGDFDSDGMTDFQEYAAGTNPGSPSDRLEFLAITQAGQTTLEFRAVAGRTYTVQQADSLGSGTWRRLADVEAQPSSGPVVVIDPSPVAAARFYRVITPANPP